MSKISIEKAEKMQFYEFISIAVITSRRKNLICELKTLCDENFFPRLINSPSHYSVHSLKIACQQFSNYENVNFKSLSGEYNYCCESIIAKRKEVRRVMKYILDLAENSP